MAHKRSYNGYTRGGDRRTEKTLKEYEGIISNVAPKLKNSVYVDDTQENTGKLNLATYKKDYT